MSILIKGMDMPKDGECKLIYIYDTGEVTVEIGDGEEQVATAVPVPPHGRLIDADTLAAVAGKRMGIINIGHIDDAPTIIPAEEDSDGRQRANRAHRVWF